MEPEGSLLHSQEPATCPYPEPDRSIPRPHPISWFILILSFYLPLGLPSGLLPSGFPIKILFAPLLSPVFATRPSHLNILDLITGRVFGSEYRDHSFLLCSLLDSPVTSSLLGPNFLPSTLFSKTLSLHFSLNVRDQLSQPYKTTGRIIVL